MSAHTPGPWVLYDADDLSNIGAARHIHSETQAMRHKSSAIAAVYGRLDAPDEREANARLIAAAPDLLEALWRIADMRDRDGNAIEMHRDELRGIARAAIAKATGAA